MGTFDRASAKAAGYSDQEIDSYLASVPKPKVDPVYTPKFDTPMSSYNPNMTPPPPPSTSPKSSGFFDLDAPGAPNMNAASFRSSNLTPTGLVSPTPVVTPGGVEIPPVAPQTNNAPSFGNMDWSKVNLGGIPSMTDPNRLKFGGY